MRKYKINNQKPPFGYNKKKAKDDAVIFQHDAVIFQNKNESIKKKTKYNRDIECKIIFLLFLYKKNYSFPLYTSSFCVI